jgi:hypothetical protein
VEIRNSYDVFVLATVEEATKLADDVASKRVLMAAEKPSLPTLPNLVIKTEPEEEPRKKAKMEKFFDDIFDADTDDVLIITNAEQAKAELQRYLAQPMPIPVLGNDKIDIIQWWKTHASAYPLISHVARKYLAIPASSTPSERVFSACGNLVCKKRARIHNEMVDQLVFLNKNMNKLKI